MSHGATLRLNSRTQGRRVPHRPATSAWPLAAAANAVSLRCPCRVATTAAVRDHAMTCTSVHGTATLRHDILKKILRRAVTRTEAASTLEPTLRRLPELETGARDGAAASATADLQTRGDILLALDADIAVADVSVTHPGTVAVRGATAATDGAAAVVRTARAQQIPLLPIHSAELWVPRHGRDRSDGTPWQGSRGGWAQGEQIGLCGFGH
jgi:hypothetical protein